VSAHYKLFWSDKSQFGMLHPRPSLEAATAFYEVDDYYTHGRSVLTTETGVAWRAVRWLAARLDRGVEPNECWWASIAGPKPIAVCEIGCGSGNNLAVLCRLGHSVVGVEPDLAARHAALHDQGIKCLPGTAEDLPQIDEKFDIVIMMHVLEHCIDPQAALRNAANLLKRGGRLVVEVPNNAAAGLRIFGRNWLWLDVPRHLNFFTERSLVRLLDQVGLRIENINYRGYWRQFSTDWLEAQNRISICFGQPHQHGLLAISQLLLCTAASPKWAKYDSVRAIAVKVV
jgi:2-polyprenyl-3-methyl-5-hydroxy-6-metoxy-1,4-benzoquinol methylase